MVKSVTGHHYRLLCKSDDCYWSKHCVVAPDTDPEPVLLLALRAHADVALHGRSIEGVAVGLNGENDVTVIVLRHP